MNQQRIKVVVAALTLSFAAAVNIAVHEGYTTNAVIPTEGDVPTYGYGSTVKPDGSRVRMGERTDPVNALKTMQAHISKDEDRIRTCLDGAYLTQGMYDVFVTFAYNIGSAQFCRSSIAQRIRDGDHLGSCEALLKYRYAAGFDCSTPGNKRCYGLWKRRLQERDSCVAALPHG